MPTRFETDGPIAPRGCHVEKAMTSARPIRHATASAFAAAELAQVLRTDVPRWHPLIESAGIEPQ